MKRTENEYMQQQLLDKKARLEKMKQTLKQEFVGIDNVIDRLANAISPWYYFSEIQEKPLVVNLWGLTGVGKTTLVKRVTELLQVDNTTYAFDFGGSFEFESANHRYAKGNFKEKLFEIKITTETESPVLVFDEFHHARTLNEKGQEGTRINTRVAWEAIDTGIIELHYFNHLIPEIRKVLKGMQTIMDMGVKIKNGVIDPSHNKLIKKNIFLLDAYENDGNYITDKSGRYFFFPYYAFFDSHHESNWHYMHFFHDMERLRKLDPKTLLKDLNERLERALKPDQLNLSKSLIFVLGNLDEAYTMGKNFSPDISADEFHEASMEITLPVIKNALQSRFRAEQIARLGNNHIIYPAFSKNNFEQLISRRLDALSKRVSEKTNVELSYHESVHQIIYKEGVYPTQGARPVITTVQNVIAANLGQIFSELYLKAPQCKEVLLSYYENRLTASYLSGGETRHHISIPLILNLEKLREEKRDDYQALVAVHESGHAVCSALILNVVPEMICSHTVDESKGGFNYLKLNWKFVARHELTKRAAVFLGGLLAEKMVFGEENVTTGSEGDIQKATAFLSKAIRKQGLGNEPHRIDIESNETPNAIWDTERETNTMVKELMRQAEQLAEQTLFEHEEILLEMADYLSDHRSIEKARIVELIQKHLPQYQPQSTEPESLNVYYRQKLKQKAGRKIAV